MRSLSRDLRLLMVERDALEAKLSAAHHLMVEADSICSLILHRESQGLSQQTIHDLDRVVTALRIATKS